MTMKKISVMVEDMDTGDRFSHIFQLVDNDRNGYARAQIGVWITDVIKLEEDVSKERWAHLTKAPPTHE